MPEIEFDPRKNRANLEKHAVDFPTAARIWEGFVVEREDERRDYGERRFLTLGVVDNRIVLVVYTWRGEKRRLISARKANDDEQEVYRTALARLQADTED